MKALLLLNIDKGKLRPSVHIQYIYKQVLIKVTKTHESRNFQWQYREVNKSIAWFQKSRTTTPPRNTK